MQNGKKIHYYTEYYYIKLIKELSRDFSKKIWAPSIIIIILIDLTTLQ